MMREGKYDLYEMKTSSFSIDREIHGILFDAASRLSPSKIPSFTRGGVVGKG